MSVLEKVKDNVVVNKFKDSKFLRCATASASAAMIAVTPCISAFATDGETSTSGTDATSILSSSLGTVQSDVLGYIAVALPVALALFGAFFGIRKAISFFKGVSK